MMFFGGFLDKVDIWFLGRFFFFSFLFYCYLAFDTPFSEFPSLCARYGSLVDGPLCYRSGGAAVSIHPQPHTHIHLSYLPHPLYIPLLSTRGEGNVLNFLMLMSVVFRSRGSRRSGSWTCVIAKE